MGNIGISTTEISVTYTNTNIDEKIKLLNDNVKKRKYSQFEKENNLNDKKNDPNSSYSNIHHTKKKKVANSTRQQEVIIKPLSKLSLNINLNQVLTKTQTNIEKNSFSSFSNLSKTAKKGDTNLNVNSRENNKTLKKVSQPRVNRFDAGSGTNFNSLNNNRRPQTTSIDSFKNLQNKKNKNSNIIKKNSKSGSVNVNKCRSAVNSNLKYCPRIHSAQVMKKVSLIFY
jgi:hypothetical protein